MESPLDVLRVDSDADEEDLEEAYRRRVKEAHPDQGGSVEEFQTVRKAYETLKVRVEETGSLTNGNGAAPRTSAAARAQSQADEQNGSRADAEPQEWTDRQEWTDDQTQTQRISSEVTYLNYDVLTDFGWETDDSDLIEKAADADLSEEDFGQFDADPGQSLLGAAEDHGFAWPFACRGGACANCAIVLLDGELSMPGSHILPEEMLERDIRLSCNGVPITSELKVLYNVKHMPDLEDLLLPPQPFEAAYPDR